MATDDVYYQALVMAYENHIEGTAAETPLVASFWNRPAPGCACLPCGAACQPGWGGRHDRRAGLHGLLLRCGCRAASSSPAGRATWPTPMAS